MNNTKTLAIVAILTAATLVVGVTFAAATTHSAFAYKKDNGKDRKDMKGKDASDNGNSNSNANTVTVQADKQKASVSGFDNTAEQEAQNLICTHPSTNCISEGSETPVVNNTSSNDDGDEHGNPGS
jgi:hypothetical protein